MADTIEVKEEPWSILQPYLAWGLDPSNVPYWPGQQFTMPGQMPGQYFPGAAPSMPSVYSPMMASGGLQSMGGYIPPITRRGAPQAYGRTGGIYPLQAPAAATRSDVWGNAPTQLIQDMQQYFQQNPIGSIFPWAGGEIMRTPEGAMYTGPGGAQFPFGPTTSPAEVAQLHPNIAALWQEDYGYGPTEFTTPPGTPQDTYGAYGPGDFPAGIWPEAARLYMAGAEMPFPYQTQAAPTPSQIGAWDALARYGMSTPYVGAEASLTGALGGLMDIGLGGGEAIYGQSPEQLRQDFAQWFEETPIGTVDPWAGGQIVKGLTGEATYTGPQGKQVTFGPTDLPRDIVGQHPLIAREWQEAYGYTPESVGRRAPTVPGAQELMGYPDISPYMHWGPEGGFIGQQPGAYGYTPELSRDMLSGRVDYTNVPGLYEAATRPMLEQFQEQILPGLRQSGIAAGHGVGGSRQGIAEGIATGKLLDRLADVSTGITESAAGRALQAQQLGLSGLTSMGDLQRALGGLGVSRGQLGLNLAQLSAQTGLGVEDLRRQLTQQQMDALARASAQAPSLAALGMTPIQTMQAGGAAQQAANQAMIEDAMRRWEMGYESPWSALRDYTDIVTVLGRAGGLTEQPAQRADRTAGALGGAMAGYGIGGPLGAGIGGLAGLLLGGL